MTRQSLLIQTAMAFIVATVFTLLVVLPAERGVDPTGFGRWAGLTQMAAPQAAAGLDAKASADAAKVTHSQPAPFRSDTLTITLTPGGGANPGSEIERKVWMEPGQTMVYAWTSDGEVYSDFHGETLPVPKMTVMTYRVEDPLGGGSGAAANGGFTAPMAGFHGWFFRNMEARPVTITVRLSGFYELRPYPPPKS
jgi:hypothetical protein